MRTQVAMLATLGVMGLLTGCGPTCQSSCSRMYSETECNIQRVTDQQTRAFRECVDQCESALQRPGELEDYDPTERFDGSASLELKNETQAAAWMDCVDETACQLLDDGYCGQPY